MKITITPSPAQFRRDLSAAERAMAAQLKEANRLAADWAAESMQSRYNSLHPRRSGRASGSFRATNDRAMFGGARVPYLLGQNFGSSRYRQFPTRTDPDHFAFSVVRKGTATIQSMYDAAVDDAMAEAFSG